MISIGFWNFLKINVWDFIYIFWSRISHRVMNEIYMNLKTKNSLPIHFLLANISFINFSTLKFTITDYMSWKYEWSFSENVVNPISMVYARLLALTGF